MKCIIIDDEPSSIEFLETVIKEYCAGIQIVAKANNINDAHQAILTYEPDLLLLDIEMPDGTGFDLLKRFDKPNFEVVFITGFNQYLLNAIRFCALDFLLKPININEFKTAIERAAVKVSEKKNNERLHLMLQNIATPNAQRLLIPTSTGYEIMPVQEIIRCEALDAYTQVHTNDKRKLIASKTIKEYEEVLINHGFFRVHNSHIVNKLHIKRYKKNDGGIVVMSDNAEIIIARRRKDDFLEWLKNDSYVPDIH